MSLSEQIHATEAAIAASDARLRVWRHEARRTVRERLVPGKRTLTIAAAVAAVSGVVLYRRRVAVARAWRRLGRHPNLVFLLRRLPIAGGLLPLPRRTVRGQQDTGAGGGWMAAVLPLLWPVALRMMANRPAPPPDPRAPRGGAPAP